MKSARIGCVLPLILGHACTSRYMIPGNDLAVARAEARGGGTMSIAAWAEDGRATRIRHDTVRATGPVAKPGFVWAEVTDHRLGQRIGGWTLVVVGAASAIVGGWLAATSNGGGSFMPDFGKVIGIPALIGGGVELGVGVWLLFDGYGGDGPEVAAPR